MTRYRITFLFLISWTVITGVTVWKTGAEPSAALLAMFGAGLGIIAATFPATSGNEEKNKSKRGMLLRKNKNPPDDKGEGDEEVSPAEVEP